MSATTTALESPEALFFTPPGSPLVDAPLVTVSTDDAFPSSADPPDGDLGIDVDGLNTLEKIFVFSLSKAAFHRIFICHSLPTFLDNVPPREAVEYVLPLLDALAVDDGNVELFFIYIRLTCEVDERVKEALVSELPAVIWWFFSVSCLFSQEESISCIHIALPSDFWHGRTLRACGRYSINLRPGVHTPHGHPAFEPECPCWRTSKSGCR